MQQMLQAPGGDSAATVTLSMQLFQAQQQAMMSSPAAMMAGFGGMMPTPPQLQALSPAHNSHQQLSSPLAAGGIGGFLQPFGSPLAATLHQQQQQQQPSTPLGREPLGGAKEHL